MNSDDKEIDRARGIGISSSESEPDSETDEEAENEIEEEQDIYDKDNPRRSGKIILFSVGPSPDPWILTDISLMRLALKIFCSEYQIVQTFPPVAKNMSHLIIIY